jgi:hypothetical protein
MDLNSARLRTFAAVARRALEDWSRRSRMA